MQNSLFESDLKIVEIVHFDWTYTLNINDDSITQ